MFPLILGLLGGLFYFGHSEVRHFENLAARDIRSSIQGEHAKVSVGTQLNGIIAGPLGDLKQVTIRASDFQTPGVPLFTQPELSKRGVIRDLRIELRNFTLAGLRIEELTADIPDCRYDYGLAIRHNKIRLSQSGLGRGEVTIEEHDLEAFVLRKFGDIKSIHISIADGWVHVEGNGEFLILKAHFKVDAKIKAIDGTKLILDHAIILLDGRLADEASRKALLDTLNPVIDLNKDLHLHDAIYVDGISLRDGVIRAEGTTKIPVEPGER